MFVTAILLSCLIGLALGLLGGGGSILTVPILVYALGVEEKAAIATSLLVVGATSAFAAVSHARRGDVDWRVALIFALGGTAGALLGGLAANHVSGDLLLTMFAALMLVAAAAMWRGRRAERATPAGPRRGGTLLLAGLVVGAMTGLIGAGGGFVVVPVLVLFGGLPMRRAIGTSLVVIAVNALAGLAAQATHTHIDLQLAALVTAAAIGGAVVGTRLAQRVPQEALRKSFAVFVVAMAVFMLTKQL